MEKINRMIERAQELYRRRINTTRMISLAIVLAVAYVADNGISVSVEVGGAVHGGDR